ncbi:hypothetical protein [Polyangium spumosum]|uniref:Uncharacterized protein n=1 Tax=Polyangium spumosum TaxID=889282 RepID=A0A6N7PZU5_9BACT|nr:hypothetical protein [Polyangium spumosum]MRG96010.1 hypothetical protein [Polyangium spumosum]
MSKDDTKKPVGVAGGQPTASKDNGREHSITLKEHQWIVVLAALERLIPGALKGIEDLKANGTDPKDLPPHLTAALGGPIVVRGIIVKELAARGVLSEEADKLVGIDSLMKNVYDTLKQQPPA